MELTKYTMVGLVVRIYLYFSRKTRRGKDLGGGRVNRCGFGVIVGTKVAAPSLISPELFVCDTRFVWYNGFSEQIALAKAISLRIFYETQFPYVTLNSA